jgi:multidrug efflux pump subunit AcrA (membrane-fusion protein)
LEVKPGMAGEATGRVELPESGPENTFELPASALFSPDGGESEKTFVWIVDPETSSVQRREVTPGEITLRGGTLVQGLEPNDRVVTAGVHWLHEGQQVRVQ